MVNEVFLGRRFKLQIKTICWKSFLVMIISYDYSHNNVGEDTLKTEKVKRLVPVLGLCLTYGAFVACPRR